MAVTLANWVTYASLRSSVNLPEVGDPDSEQALVRGADYIRTQYEVRIPNLDADRVEEATYLAANYELATPGFWTTTFTPGTAKVLTEVKGIKWTLVGGSVSGPASMLPVSPAIHALLDQVPLPALGLYVL